MEIIKINKDMKVMHIYARSTKNIIIPKKVLAKLPKDKKLGLCASIQHSDQLKNIQKQIPNFYFHEAPMGEDPDKRNYIVSNAKLEKAGFKATITLSETITELIKGLRLIRPRQYKNA